MPQFRTFGHILVNHSGKALDVAGGSTADGASIIQSHKADVASQLFKFDPVDESPTVFRIVNKNSDKVVQVGSGNPARIIQAQRQDNIIGQAFSFREQGTSFFLLANTFFGGDFVLDVRGGSLDDGAEIILYGLKKQGQDNQLWKFATPVIQDDGDQLPPGPCTVCDNRPAGQPKCSGFVGHGNICELPFCRHAIGAHS